MANLPPGNVIVQPRNRETGTGLLLGLRHPRLGKELTLAAKGRKLLPRTDRFEEDGRPEGWAAQAFGSGVLDGIQGSF